MRLLLAGGGTGGHIYPALTVAEAIREQAPGAEFLYCGTEHGLEADVVPKAGYRFASIAAGGMVGLGVAAKVRGALRTARGVAQAMGVIRRYKPQVVIGSGGYVSGPVLLAARLVGCPCVVVEMDVFPGTTNRLAARWAKAVFVPHPVARQYFPAGTNLVVTGVPVRNVFSHLNREEGRQAFGFAPADQVVLVMAGSGGAQAVHDAMVGAAPALLRRPGLRLLHVTGNRYYDKVVAAYRAAGVDLDKPGSPRLERYLHNMPEAYAAADVAVVRAGAITLAEVAAAGVPAVVIPSPNVSHNHQEYNARVLEQAGAARMLLERDLTADRLQDTLSGLLDDPDRRASMAEAGRRNVRPEAAADIAQHILRIAGDHGDRKGGS